jgi:pimeloyl-ACP methyl ester carboxylesterase
VGILVPDAVASVTHVAGLAIRSLELGDGPRLVVLHHDFGNPGWMPLYGDLAADHDVAVPDLPGFGDSARPPWARSTRDLALLMGHWLRATGDGPAIVVGCGFGGWVGAELATMAPELLSHLVLVGPAGIPPVAGEIFDQMMVNHAEYVYAAFHDEGAFRAVFPELTDDVLLRLDTCREMVTRVTWKPYMYNRALEPLLRAVTVPTLLVWGARDRVVPLECGQRYLAALVDARLEIVEGAGHAVDLERPDRLAELIRAHVGAPLSRS